MKRIVFYLAVFSCFLLLMAPISVRAAQVPAGGNTPGTGGSSTGSSDESSSSGSGVTVPISGELAGEFSGEYAGTGEEGGSGTISGELSGEFSGEIELPYPNYTTYYPKVTSLRSANALLADAGEAVYFLPTLEDFPADIKNVVTDLTDGNGKAHKFAIVYDGYFNRDVLLQADTASDPDNSRVHTSKKVYSMDYNSRLCTYLGYDILLREERFVIDTEPALKTIEFNYNATRVNNSILDTQTMMMDLYKAMGVYEWDIEFAYGIDKDFNANTSPILQSVGFLTTDKNQGLNTEESFVWVAATRSNPDLYWLRCERDLIFDGGAHLYDGDYWGNEVSVTGNFSRSYTPTLGEFCAMARAVMSLYGEPVMTKDEQMACMEAYGLYLPSTGFQSDIYDSLVYLAAKGIIDPEGKDFDSLCTFDDIEEILLRIADEGSRLTIKTPVWNMLTSRGFARIEECILAAPGVSTVEMQSGDLPYYDFLIEVKPGYTEYMTYVSKPKIEYTYGVYAGDTGPFAINKNNVGLITSTDITEFTNESGRGYAALDATGITLGLRINEPEQSDYSGDGIIGFFTSDDAVLNRGIVTYDGKQYYHMQAALNAEFGGMSAVSRSGGGGTIDLKTAQWVFTYRIDEGEEDNLVRRDPSVAGYRVREQSDTIFALDLPNGLGGVYEIDDDGRVHWYRFADRGYDVSFRDSESTLFNVPGLSDYHASNTLIALSIPMDDSIHTNDIVSSASIAFSTGWQNVLTTHNTVFDMGDGKTKAYSMETDVDDTGMRHLWVEFYCTDGGVNLKNDGGYKYLTQVKNINSRSSSDTNNIAFYRAESGTLLVSTNSLLNKGILASVHELSKTTYLIAVNGSSSKMTTNVTIHYEEGASDNFICVGNTLFPCKTMSNPNEVLFEFVDGAMYVNYRALMGWGCDVIMTPMSSSGTVYAYTTDWISQDALYSSDRRNIPTYASQTINEYMPVTNTYVSRLHVYASYGTASSEHEVDGISLLSSYCLAPYLMVTGPRDSVTGDTTDYLFTWHIKGTNSNTKDVDDSAVREKFAQLTGITTPQASDVYYMSCIAMSQKDHWNPWGNYHSCVRRTNNDVSSFTYAHKKLNSKQCGTIELSYGWVYTPPYYANVPDAVKAWDNLTYHPDFKDTNRERYIGLPLFATGTNSPDTAQVIGNANLNHCLNGSGTMQPGGTLPGYFASSDSGITTLQNDGRMSTPSNSPAVDLASYKVIPAPTGKFAAFTAGISNKLSEVSSGSNTIFWGTARISSYDKKNDKVKIGTKGVLPIDKDTPVVRVFTGTIGSDIWVIDTGMIAISGLPLDGGESFGFKVFDTFKSIDWEQYKFSRLVRSIDSWSTVLLIFILNILPRVCILLFFLLLLLSLLAPYPQWRAFCNQYFDPYSFLTNGHQNVNTVQLKRLLISSSIGIVAFYIIMDGAAISIILWIADWFIRLTN